MVDCARACHLTIASLNTVGPSLEEVFIKMTGITLPFFMFLSWSVGRNKPAGALIPGLIAITVFFTASSIGPVVIPWEKRVHTFERLLTAPVSLPAILLGKTLAGVVFGLAVAVVPLVVGLLLGAQVTDPVGLIVGLALAAGAFSSLGVLFSTLPGQNVGSVMMFWAVFLLAGLRLHEVGRQRGL